MGNNQLTKPFPAEDASYRPNQLQHPLPSSILKSLEEDPDAPERTRKIMEHPCFRRADQDLDLLKRDELRPIRLQLEFLKPELVLAEHRICGAIVVLGATRIIEPAAARRKVERARKALDDMQQKRAHRPG